MSQQKRYTTKDIQRYSKIFKILKPKIFKYVQRYSNKRYSKIFKPNKFKDIQTKDIQRYSKTFKPKIFKDIQTTWRNAWDTVSPSMFPATQLYTPRGGRVSLRCSLEQLLSEISKAL